MNRYGRKTREHWARFLPRRHGATPDPETYFSTLGDEVQGRVTAQTTRIAGDDPAGEGYLTKLGRLNAARGQAEEIVLPEMVLLPAESGSPEDEDTDQEPAATGDRWSPMVEDPSDPFWARQTR